MTDLIAASSRDNRQGHTSGCSDIRFRFPKTCRLLTARDFSAVFNDAPYRAAHSCVLVLARDCAQGQARLGLVVAKKNIKKAVNRNRFKRITRESFRLQQHKLPPIDAIVLARRGADSLSTEELHQILNGLWSRIQKRYQSASCRG